MDKLLGVGHLRPDMEITDVNVFMMEGSGNLKAFVDVTMDGEFAVHGLKVLETDGELWVGMPGRYDKKNDRYRDVFHPISREAKDKLSRVVLEEYKRKSGQE